MNIIRANITPLTIVVLAVALLLVPLNLANASIIGWLYENTVLRGLGWILGWSGAVFDWSMNEFVLGFGKQFAGGMGEVYKGENVYTNDPVAIKVILDKLAQDAKAAALFMREAKTLSQLSDDAIVRYYNFVRDPSIDRFCLLRTALLSHSL